MEFSNSARVESVRPRVLAIMEKVCALEPELLERGFRSVLPSVKILQDEVRREGLWAPQIAAEHGGAGFSLLEFAAISELLGRSPLGHFTFNCQAPDAGNMEVLAALGTPEQKARWLGPLVRGELRSCFAMTEPDHPGSNPTWLGTTAEEDGDHFVIHGTKWFTSSAEGAAFAIVMAVTDPDAPPHLRASQILVPTETVGFVRVRNIPVMGDRGEDYASHAEVAFEGCRVPKSNLLGPRGAGFAVAQERLGPGRIHHTMRWIGIAERAMDLMCRRAASREIAPGRKLGEKQLVAAWIAECRAKIDAARLLVLRAAWLLDQRRDAKSEVSAIKFFVADVMSFVIDRAIQTHGALGLTDELILSYFYRHERAAHIYDGADEVHKISLGKRILQSYAATGNAAKGYADVSKT